jgi:excisionase family DNA binding protein
MLNKPELAPLRTYLTVAAAAKFLGVSASTLRHWDRTGKLKPARHPINRYRLYRRADLEGLLRRVDADATEGAAGVHGG